MTKSWLDLLTVALSTAVFCIACFDFLLGKDGRRRVQSHLESLWLHFSYIRWPSLGMAEARAFLAWLDRAFGPRFLSWRRLTTTTLLVMTLICVAYVIIEGTRAFSGKEIRWPFAKPHWETGFPYQILPAMVSISITRLMVVGSIRILSLVRGGTVLFIFTVGLAGYLSTAIAFAIAFSFDAAIFALQASLATAYDYAAVISGGGSANIDYFEFFELWWFKIKIGLSLAWLAVRRPTEAWVFFFSLVQYNDTGLVRAWYDFCISVGFGSIRLVFASAFIGIWTCLTPIRWFTSVVLLRLAEAERGALTALGIGFALLAKLVQEYLKVSPG